jgi:hypothetical protein
MKNHTAKTQLGKALEKAGERLTRLPLLGRKRQPVSTPDKHLPNAQQDQPGSDKNPSPTPPVKENNQPDAAERAREGAHDTGATKPQMADPTVAYTRSIAAWTRIVAVATTVYMIFTGLQFCAVNRQASLMQKQLEVTDRPWLSVDVATEDPLVFRKDAAFLSVKYTVRNVGRSVANKAMVISDIFIGKLGEDIPAKAIERQRHICEYLPLTITTHTVFPGDVFIDRQLIAAGRPEMEHGREGNNYLPFFLIIGCVDYWFGDQPTRHRTNFIYEVNGPDRHSIQIGQDVPADGLIFVKFYSGGDSAY